MDGDWDEVHRIVVFPSGYNELPAPASTIAFDTEQELLWVGGEYGRIISFFGIELRKYTSYYGHPADEGPVKQLLFHERGVISVAPKSIHLSSRRGLTQWHLADESTIDLCCMSFVGKDHGQILVAGCQNVMLKLDVEKGRVIESIPTDYHYTAMKHCKYLCAATSTGEINLLDVDNLRIVKTLTTNNVSISDMDARNNYLVSCGWVNRPQGTPMLSTLANVFDLRSMVQLPPIPFHAGAAYVQMHPKMSTTCILASQSGQLQVVDLMNSNTVNLRQANISNYMSKLVQAPSGEALTIADADGSIHLWGSPSKLQFSEYSSQVTEWADNSEPAPFIDVDQEIPFNTIGMPYYREQLLSAWSNTQVYEVGNPPPKIDSLVLSTMRTNEIGLWGPNPHKTRRNQAEKTRLVESNGSTIAPPKFLSEKARASETSLDTKKHINDIQEALLDAALSDSTKTDVPIMYRNVEIKYSRFGVDDFDFEYYNKTDHSGLETHITNSYTNSLLQLFKFTPLIRNLALHHTASNCIAESCLLCEMGFLFDTLEKAEGQNCQATNFLKAFSGIPQAGRLGLLEESSQGSPLTEMVQGACRFMLTQIVDDFRRISPQNNALEQTVTIDALASIRCTHCHNDIIRPGPSHVTDLIYQPVTATHRLRQQYPTFSQVLKSSIELQISNRGWCDKCRRYQQLATRKAVRGVPDVLMINAALKSDEAKQYWAVPGWLPDSIGVLLDAGKFFCFEGEDLRLHLQKRMHVIKVYDLVGIVADINSGEHQKSHLVSMINVGLSRREASDDRSWHLFNDFLVRRISPEEALTSIPSWKVPSVLAFQAGSARYSIDDSWKNSLDTSILYQNWSINNRTTQNCRVLDPNSEAPVAGSYVAIDTEFVALQQEEIEIKADGEREIVRPTRLGLARVSVLRGSGEDEGLPFINDYITIREDIVDYLTKYSGVQHGDLDPKFSPHNLVPLKVAYKKLWLLLNLGCIFIGHGLPKDFRTINIHVPKAQVLDTVDLFYIRARQRRLSLRYLAWHLLREEIQQDNHDSIEDARTALRLWRKYEEFKDAGIIDTMLEDIYREGKKYGYKPPGEAAALAARRSEMRSTDGGTSSSALGVPAMLDGRETPDILRQRESKPGTPMGKKGTRGRSEEYFESPLR